MNANEHEVCERCGYEIDNGHAMSLEGSDFDVLCDPCFRSELKARELQSSIYRGEVEATDADGVRTMRDEQ